MHPMNIVIFGLSISSSWGNGHATIWRGLIRGLVGMGHSVFFFEKNVPYYESNRDFTGCEGLTLFFYDSFSKISSLVSDTVKKSDVSMVTSYCPDALEASEIIFQSGIFSVFYDLDTPVTLYNIKNGNRPQYIGLSGLDQYDLVLSYTGGKALDGLKSVLSARHVFPLYGCADPFVYKYIKPVVKSKTVLSYLGTFAGDRQQKLEDLFIRPAQSLPQKKFLIGGAQYPPETFRSKNIIHKEHVPPPHHRFFYSSSKFTLNITRSAMAEMGYCPSGRLFEASLCGVPIISDRWEGIDLFFEPGGEIMLVDTSQDVLDVLSMSDSRREKISRRAVKRASEFHTSEKRARELIAILKEGKE